MRQQSGQFDIRQVAPSDRVAALEQLMQTSASSVDLTEDQVAAYASQLGVDYAHLWSGYDGDGQLIGPSVLIVLRPGRTGMVFTSPVLRRSEMQRFSQVVGKAVSGLFVQPVGMLQALVEPTEDLLRLALIESGFVELAELEYLQRSVPRNAPPPAWPSDVSIQPYGPQCIDDFARALESSYEQTLDCPMLRGLRRTEDVIEGHMAAGRFVADLWTLLRIGGEPAGVLLMAPIDSQQCVELVYLGLAPIARGRGLGTALIQWGLSQCAQLNMPLMTLAVDHDNRPATRLYRRQGFYRVARRQAMVMTLKP